MLESFNLFPETRYFKVKGSAELDHKCGGFISLSILIVCIGILVVKLMDVFNRDTIFFTSEEKYNIEPPMATLSTYQNSTHHNPYMLALRHSTHSCFEIETPTAYHYHYKDLRSPSRSWVRTEIKLEKCTAQHFSKIPAIRDSFSSLGVGRWWCFPLNQTYQLGGHYDISDIEKSIALKVKCKKSCFVNSCGNVAIFQLSSIINPSNNTSPFEYHLSRNDVHIYNTTYKQYVAHIDQNILETDQSFLPLLTKTVRQTSINNQPIKERISIEYQHLQDVDIWLERSSKTTKVKRHYYKLFDVLSYVGGIFPALFSFFFFMKFFGIYFFEMTFAYQHFKCQETKNQGFSHFVKRVAYNILRYIGCAMKNWKIAKRQCQINETVNHLLQITYLFKRIQFLEKAISFVFDEHQLKGIYLSQVRLQQASEDYKKRQLRDRMIKYLYKKATKEKEKKQRDKHERQEEMNAPRQGRSKAKKELMEKSRQSKGPPMKQSLEYIMGLENISRKEFKKEQPVEMLECSEEALRRMDHQNLIAKESSTIMSMDQSELNEEQISEQLQNDLKKLFREAKKKKGDPKSKRIVESLDEYLRSELQIAIDDYEEQNPRFQMRLREETGNTLA